MNAQNKGWWTLISTIVILLAPASAWAQAAQPAGSGVIDAEVSWDLQKLPGNGSRFCYVSARKAGNAVGPESRIVVIGPDMYTATAQEGVATQVVVTCKSEGTTTPEGTPDGNGIDRPKGHAFWFCPTGTRAADCLVENKKVSAPSVKTGETSEINWRDGSDSVTIKINWFVGDAPAAHSEIAPIYAKAEDAWKKSDDANTKADEAKDSAEEAKQPHTLRRRVLSVRGAYVRSIDTQDEPARSGFLIGLEGYLFGGDNSDGPFKMSVGAVVTRSEWQVPVLNAPNLQEPNAYVDGNKTFVGPTVGVNWNPWKGLLFNLRGALGFWIWENGTADLSQTQGGAVFISPSSTDRPISGRLEFDAGYAIGDIVSLGLGLGVTRNFESAQTFRGFDLPGFTIHEGYLTDVDLLAQVGVVF